MILAVLGLIAVPLFVSKNLQLGSTARSPQTVEMILGSTAVVAGGRAKIWYAGGDTGGDFEIQCSRGKHYFQAMIDEPREGCGVKVTWTKLEQMGTKPSRATFKVEW